MSTQFTPITGFLGGALIGLAAVLLLVANGRIAGVSGIAGGVLGRVRGDVAWRVAFIAGLGLGAVVYRVARGEPIVIDAAPTLALAAAAGLLVGFGTRLGSGCTSGHGICGIARFSKRSTAATVVFMASAMLTVYVVRHLLRS
ncbi:MAG TPA: YeeE/YedE thiosulfate transporter family protein [Burkholderiales bacterium]|nr:YeeE/YedE thiosulfate transporter family protein [Burkholderiales bacterium]